VKSAKAVDRNTGLRERPAVNLMEYQQLASAATAWRGKERNIGMDPIAAKQLESLNFSDILDYARPIKKMWKCELPFNTCNGFCHDCEDKGIPPKKCAKVVRMSHGCTSSDFEQIIGSQLPETKCSLPIMFLLENPGGDYDLGNNCTCDGVTKQPPNKHFYFSSGMKRWPTDVSEIGGNHYGDYFAYLMAKFGLSNVYITNCIKCKYDGSCYSATADNCIKRFLVREIRIFRPRLIVCFSKQVSDELLYKRIESPGILSDVPFKKVRLLHPAAVDYPKWKGNWEGVVGENDMRLGKALADLVPHEIEEQ